MRKEKKRRRRFFFLLKERERVRKKARERKECYPLIQFLFIFSDLSSQSLCDATLLGGGEGSRESGATRHTRCWKKEVEVGRKKSTIFSSEISFFFPLLDVLSSFVFFLFLFSSCARWPPRPSPAPPVAASRRAPAAGAARRCCRRRARRAPLLPLLFFANLAAAPAPLPSTPEGSR